jgi:Family of unknown function (DUF6412)
MAPAWIRQLIAVMATAIAAVIIAGAQPDLRSMLALTIATIAVALAATALAGPEPSVRAASISACHETRIAPRHCDPDAAGRPRPRAPTAV